MKILCIGDSITDAGHLFDPAQLGFGYVQYLDSFFQSQNPEVKVINKGIDGFTVQRLLENASGNYLPLEPDIITVLIGINDVGLLMNTDRTSVQKEALIDDFFHSLDSLLTILTPPVKKRLVLMEPFIFTPPGEYINWFPYLHQICDNIQSLADQYQLPYLPLQDSLTRAAQIYGNREITSDGIHLTRLGHKILACKLLELLITEYPELNAAKDVL